MTPPGPLGAKMTEEMAKSRISAPLNGVWGVREGSKRVQNDPFWDPLFDPFWPVRAKSDAFHRCYLGGSGQGAQKGGPKRGHFGPPPRAPDPPKPLKKWTKVRIQLEDLGSEGPLGPPQRAILAPPF